MIVQRAIIIGSDEFVKVDIEDRMVAAQFPAV